jgi:hypothetical protein
MNNVSKINKQTPFSLSSHNGVCVGQIIDISLDGKVIVDFPGNKNGRIGARCIEGLISRNDCERNLPVSVLLVFEQNDPSLPIIVGKISDVVPTSDFIVGRGELTDNLARFISIDGESVVLEANKEILLRCGKSSIVSKKNGKIVVKGTEIISRSSGNNKLKGATVNIN